MSKPTDWRKRARQLARAYLIEKYDESPDGKMEKLINALYFGLLFGPHPVADVREEVGEWYPGWCLGCDILGYLIDDMPRHVWVNLDYDGVSETEPDAYETCPNCEGTGTVDGDECQDCDGEGTCDVDLSSTYQVDSKEALCGTDLKGYIDCPSDTWEAAHFVSRYWGLPEWKIKRLRATERRREQIAARQARTRA